MKLLIIFSSYAEAKHFLEWLSTGKKNSSELESLFFETPYSLYSYEKEGILIDVVIVGQTGFESAFHLGRILSNKRYHLALQLGIAISNDDKIPFASICNVINDKPLESGIHQNGALADLYSSSFLDIAAYPHQLGGLVNKTNAYFNVFLEFKKVASASLSILYADDLMKQNEIKNVYQSHIHTLGGIGFSFACLYAKQSFYQLRIIVNDRSTASMDVNTALDKAMPEFIETIKKIS
ncbi:MAG: hypothetical protein WCP57_10930 [Bacteroidota bacterium]